YAANPDLRFAEQALASIPFKVMVNSTLNLSHVHGIGEEAIVLPIRVRDEETQPTTQESMFNFVRMSDGGFDRIADLRSEVEIISTIASRVIPPEVFDFAPFRRHREIRKAIARIIAGCAKLAEMVVTTQEYQTDCRISTSPVLNTR